MLKLTFHQQLKEYNCVVTQDRRKLIYLLPHSCADLHLPSFVKKLISFHELIKKIIDLKKIYFLRLGNPSDNLGLLNLESAHGENKLPDVNCRSNTLSTSLSAFTSHFMTVILKSMAKKISYRSKCPITIFSQYVDFFLEFTAVHFAFLKIF